MPNSNVVKLVAVGDVMANQDSAFDPTRSLLKGADITFGQLESILSKRGTIQVFEQAGFIIPRAPAPRPQYASPEPEVMAQILANAGFNVMSFASNHSFNRSAEGIIDTLEALNSKGISPIGAGKDIGEATKPAIFDKKGTKVGLLAYCSVVTPGGWAGPGKAGIAPLRANTSYEQIDWQPGSPPHTLSHCNKDDLAGMVDDIKKLRPQVDVLVVSMHWGVHMIPGLIADYQFEGGHAAIDAGADLVIGHHAHILKGIEVYKGKAIFYSLCNFAFASPNKISPMKASGLYWLKQFGHLNEVDMEHPYYAYPRDSQKTMMVTCDIADKKLKKVAYAPCWVNPQNQTEVISASDPRGEEHFKYMQWCCGSQGLDTNLSREGDEVIVKT